MAWMPSATNSTTVLPGATSLPAAGSWRNTCPAGAVDPSSTSNSEGNPRSCKKRAASFASRPTTIGTVTGVAPELIVISISSPCSNSVRAAGFWAITSLAPTVSLASYTSLTKNPEERSERIAAWSDNPTTSGTDTRGTGATVATGGATSSPLSSTFDSTKNTSTATAMNITAAAVYSPARDEGSKIVTGAGGCGARGCGAGGRRRRRGSPLGSSRFIGLLPRRAGRCRRGFSRLLAG